MAKKQTKKSKNKSGIGSWTKTLVVVAAIVGVGIYSIFAQAILEQADWVGMDLPASEILFVGAIFVALLWGIAGGIVGYVIDRLGQ